MLRSRDFYLKDVFDEKGKKLGIVEDIFINFPEGIVEGILISSYSLFSKRNYIDIKDVLFFDNEIIVKKAIRNDGFKLSKIKGLDIIDMDGNMKGVVEDIIFDKKDFSLKGIIVNVGLIERLIKGKVILLINQCILGENYILYSGNSDVILKSIAHGV